MIKIIKNKWLPFKPYAAMALGKLIFVREEARITKRLLAHELVHVAQYERLGMIRFLAIWIWEYITKGYNEISLEIEAYDNESDQFYLDWAESVLKDNNIEYS